MSTPQLTLQCPVCASVELTAYVHENIRTCICAECGSTGVIEEWAKRQPLPDNVIDVLVLLVARQPLSRSNIETLQRFLEQRAHPDLLARINAPLEIAA